MYSALDRLMKSKVVKSNGSMMCLCPIGPAAVLLLKVTCHKAYTHARSSSPALFRGLGIISSQRDRMYRNSIVQLPPIPQSFAQLEYNCLLPQVLPLG